MILSLNQHSESDSAYSREHDRMIVADIPGIEVDVDNGWRSPWSQHGLNSFLTSESLVASRIKTILTYILLFYIVNQYVWSRCCVVRSNENIIRLNNINTSYIVKAID